MHALISWDHIESESSWFYFVCRQGERKFERHLTHFFHFRGIRRWPWNRVKKIDTFISHGRMEGYMGIIVWIITLMGENFWEEKLNFLKNIHKCLEISRNFIDFWWFKKLLKLYFRFKKVNVRNCFKIYLHF